MGDSWVTQLLRIYSERFLLDCDPVCESAETKCDLNTHLVDMKGDNYFQILKTIILYCGSNDAVSDDFNKDLIHENYEQLVTASSGLSSATIITGLCPRSDHICGNMVQVNKDLKNIVEQMK